MLDEFHLLEDWIFFKNRSPFAWVWHQSFLIAQDINQLYATLWAR